MKKKSSNVLTSQNLYYTLKTISQDDCYLEEFLHSSVLEDLLSVLETHDIVYVASDDRVMLTTTGEKIINSLFFNVEIQKEDNKIYKINL